MHLFREEDFGIIYGKPFEKVNVYRAEVLPLIERGVEDVSAYVQKKIKILRSNFHLRAPMIAFIELTRACNLRCLHCYNSSGECLEKELSTDEILALLDQLNEMKVFVVLFTGGEPLLRTDFPIILEYANSLDLQLGLITNGTLINPKTLKNIPKRIAIGISTDALGQLEHIRKGTTFAKLEDVFRLLKRENHFFSCLITMTRPGLPELDELFGYLIEWKIPFSYFHCFPLGRAQLHPELIPTPADLPLALKIGLLHEECESLFASMSSERLKTCSSVDNYWDLVYRLEESLRMCKGGRLITYIQADGTVYPCSNCASAGLFPAGNIRQKSFKELWQESFREIRAIYWNSFSGCNRCKLNELGITCEFRCPPLSKVLRKDPFECGASSYLKKWMLFLWAVEQHTLHYNITRKELRKEMVTDPVGWCCKQYLEQIMRNEIPSLEK